MPFMSHLATSNVPYLGLSADSVNVFVVAKLFLKTRFIVNELS